MVVEDIAPEHPAILVNTNISPGAETGNFNGIVLAGFTE
jgi:hypothetical protein